MTAYMRYQLRIVFFCLPRIIFFRKNTSATFSSSCLNHHWLVALHPVRKWGWNMLCFWNHQFLTLSIKRHTLRYKGLKKLKWPDVLGTCFHPHLSWSHWGVKASISLKDRDSHPIECLKGELPTFYPHKNCLLHYSSRLDCLALGHFRLFGS